MCETKTYTGSQLDHVGFPLGGLGAGMFVVEGTGSFASFSLKHAPNVNLEPCLFAAVTVKGEQNTSRVVEAQVPKYKIFGGSPALREKRSAPAAETKATGLMGTTYGLPRFREAVFQARFPFVELRFSDDTFPLLAGLTAWSPFTPPNADDSSYPGAYLEYHFTNPTQDRLDAVFYFSSMNFLALGVGRAPVKPCRDGFLLSQEALEQEPWEQAAFLASIPEPGVKVNTALFRGGWFDSLTMLWNDILAGRSLEASREEDPDYPEPGASLSLEFSLEPGESRTIPVQCCWYVPESKLRIGRAEDRESKPLPPLAARERYRPWYAQRFDSVEEVSGYLRENRRRLYEASKTFSDTFYASTLPVSVLDAVGSNLGILKSPTLLRQYDGRLWCWEGCCDEKGSCEGSCTHVWNYAQALCHLFPALERTLRETEFLESQDETGHQSFRSALPIGRPAHDFYPAADGQLGGIVKVYRDFRICGDLDWLRRLWPQVKQSMEFCIRTWDKKREGILKEPHHNTYDIEFWGADCMCSSFYLSALKAMTEMCALLGEDPLRYGTLLNKGMQYFTERLFNGEYFYQQVEWEGLKAKLPKAGASALMDRLSEEAEDLIQIHGPKYQYGTGCLSDGVLGFWMAKTAGLEDFYAPEKIASHLQSVYRYNLRTDLFTHSNTQRPGFALGNEAGLLLCTWPKGGKPALPFVYSDEVWTGIEYQTASHLIFAGEVEKGLDVVEKCRSRYRGDVRNPFDEYECGHWYGRALASYALLQALTGIRYDAYEKKLVLSPRIPGDFASFLATDSGYGLAGLENGKPFCRALCGSIPVKKFEILP